MEKDLDDLYNRELDEISLIVENYWTDWLNGKITKTVYDEKYKIWNERFNKIEKLLNENRKQF